MKTLLNQQLYKFLLDILNDALMEKNEETNYINELIIKSNSNISKQKWCNQCGKDKIENSKRKCPQCNAKLDNIAEI
jgi:rubrerythrin